MSGLAVLNAGLAGLGSAGAVLKSKRDYEQETARFDTEQKQREANLEGTQLENLHRSLCGYFRSVTCDAC
jgi:hypothetical protein